MQRPRLNSWHPPARGRRLPVSRFFAVSGFPGVWGASFYGAGGLGPSVSLVPEGVQARLFRDEALRTGTGVVLGAGRPSLLLAAAPATGFTAPGMVWGGGKPRGKGALASLPTPGQGQPSPST